MPNVYEVQPTNENGDLVSLVTRTSTIYDNNGNPIGGFATENELCEAYEPTKTYPTYSKYCIYNNAFYKYTGTGTSTGAFDDTKWTLTNFAEVGQALMGTADISTIGDGSVTGAITALNSTLAGYGVRKLSDLGLTTPCTVRQIVNALPNGCCVVISLSGGLVSDANYTGELYIRKATDSNVIHKTDLVIRTNASATTSLDGHYLIGMLPGTGNTVWYKPTLTAV